MFTLGIAVLIVCRVFHQANLLSRPFAVWGLAGYTVILCGSALEVLGNDLLSTHILPGAALASSYGLGGFIGTGGHPVPLPSPPQPGRRVGRLEE